jgi:hypothetical protein
MTDKPILFSAPMVRALLAGNKTQTRRVLKGAWQNALEGHDRVKTWFAPPNVPKEGIPNLWAQSGIWAEKHGPRGGYIRFLGFAPYRPGDLLWVREAFTKTPAGISYAADGVTHFGAGGRLKVTPSMFMPRWASRITLEVTGVKVERLQDIKGADIIAEGSRCQGCFDTGRSACMDGGCFAARDAFRALWNSINGPGAWEANPWVAAYTFRVISTGEQADAT